VKRIGEIAGVDGPSRTVPCSQCKQATTISAFGWYVAKQCSLILAAKGEPPLGNDELVRCAACAAKDEADRVEAEHRRHKTGQRLLEHLRNGHVSAEDVAWLHRNGFRQAADAICERRKRADAKSRAKSKQQAPLEDL